MRDVRRETTIATNKDAAPTALWTDFVCLPTKMPHRWC